MQRVTTRLALCGILIWLCGGGDWPGFRGPDGRGTSDEKLGAGLDGGGHVAWKVPLPGRGPSSPIVVGDRVVVTAASGPRQDVLHVLAFDAGSGELVWHRQLWATGSCLYNNFGGVAANTPASDGQAIFAFFSSGDLASFDLDGNLRWLRGLGSDFPAARNDVGMASSPLVVGRTVIVQMESLSDGFAAGLDADTGVTRWQIPREKAAVWCSPTVLRCSSAPDATKGGKTSDDVVLLQSRSRLTANDPQSGEAFWHFDVDCHTIATVTTSNGTVYLPANGLHALRPTSDGVEELWHQPVLRSGNSSPTVCQGRAYAIKPPGILVVGDVRDGSVLWQLRLKGPFWSSPVIVDGRLIIVNHDGLAQVVRLGDTSGQVVAKFELEPEILASPAVAGGAVFCRGNQYLWKIVP